MIKVRKAYVLVIAGLLASLCIASASAAFGFSSPITTIVAGPGLSAAGPTTFNTYSNQANMFNAGASADAAVNAYSPVPGCLPAMPLGLFPWSWGPTAVSNAANTMANTACGTSNTLATSFSTAGAAGLGLGAAYFTGAYPQFALDFF